MRISKRPMTNVLLAGTLIVGAGAGHAGQIEDLYQDEVGDDAGELGSGDVTDERMHRFIEAAHEVVALRAQYAERIAAADGEDRAALQAEAGEAMAGAIEAQGLGVAEYRSIGYLLDNDAALRDQLDAVAAAGPPAD